MSTTYLLDELIEERRNDREELRKQTVNVVLKTLTELSKTLSFENAYIFGSLARPYSFLPTSDIDVGFIGLKDHDFFRTIARLSRELGRDVDVVQLEGHKLNSRVVKEGISWKKSD